MIGASGVESSGGSELMVRPVVDGMQKGIPAYACYATACLIVAQATVCHERTKGGAMLCKR
jgi:hypothetical protein